MTLEHEQNPTIDSDVRQLAEVEAEQRKLQAQYDASYNAWFAENQALITKLEALKADVKTRREAIAAKARRVYEETRERRPQQSVHVYERGSLKIDEEQARAWALEMGRDDLLSVNKKAFAEVARTGIVPPEVARYEQEIIVRIDKLGEYTISNEDTQPVDAGTGGQVGITPSAYGEGTSIGVSEGALMLLNKAAARLVNAAVEAIQLVIANHPNVTIAEPMPLSPTRLAFSAMRGEQPLQGQEDFAHELQTCKSDAELVIAIAARIEQQMALPPTIRTGDEPQR